MKKRSRVTTLPTSTSPVGALEVTTVGGITALGFALFEVVADVEVPTALIAFTSKVYNDSLVNPVTS